MINPVSRVSAYIQRKKSEQKREADRIDFISVVMQARRHYQQACEAYDSICRVSDDYDRIELARLQMQAAERQLIYGLDQAKKNRIVAHPADEWTLAGQVIDKQA